MKIYIAGKISDDPNYKQKFQAKAEQLRSIGYKVLSPAVLPLGFEHDEYLRICYAMIDVCDGVYLLEDWRESKGARLEREYAVKNNKMLVYEPEISASVMR